jgi:CheY-like chemotaxis protein
MGTTPVLETNMVEAGAPAEAPLEHKRIGLVSCGAMEAAVTAALQQAKASFGHVDANVVEPGSPDLGRYHALILRLADGAPPGPVVESNWFRPELLRKNLCPLLLAGEPAAINYRVSLQSHADDIIFAPFSPYELIFRLARLTGVHESRHVAVPPARPCVLVADDDRDILIYLKNLFRNLDVDAHFVSDGRAALAAARRLLPDLLLLDVRMPFMNGLDVLRSLRKDPGTSALVTVLLTGSAETSHVKESAELGVVEYILKPFGHLDLILKLKPLLRASEFRSPVTAVSRNA